jgi:hypothetical protein
MGEVREIDMIVTVHLQVTTQEPGELGPVMLAITKRFQEKLQALAVTARLDLPESQTYVSVGKVLGAGVPRG